MKIFVASLPFNIVEADLLAAFSAFGMVDSVKVITDKYSGRSRGYAFIEMPDEQRARMAINELNGAEVHGRTIVVSESQERDQNRAAGFEDHNYGHKSSGFNIKRPRKPMML